MRAGEERALGCGEVLEGKGSQECAVRAVGGKGEGVYVVVGWLEDGRVGCWVLEGGMHRWVGPGREEGGCVPFSVLRRDSEWLGRDLEGIVGQPKGSAEREGLREASILVWKRKESVKASGDLEAPVVTVIKKGQMGLF